MKGMILAAGFGTRFRPATYEIPKPMIPLCNRPLIDWALDAMMDAGVREVVVNLHHLPDPLEQHLRDRYGDECELHFSLEETILGTGGGIRRARRWLDGPEPFLLANGDTLQCPPFAQLAARVESDDALAALLLRHPPESDRFTPVFFDGRRVTGFGEGSGEVLMFAGAHAISPRIFELLPDRDFSGITEEVYIPATRAGEPPIAGVVDDGLWFDIGTPARYMEASAAVLEAMAQGTIAVPVGSSIRGGSLIAERSGAEGELRGVVLGEGASVAGGAVCSESVLWDRAQVSTGANVGRSILGPGVLIPEGANVQNALVCRRIEGIGYPEGTAEAGEFVAVPIRGGQATLEGLTPDRTRRRPA